MSGKRHPHEPYCNLPDEHMPPCGRVYGRMRVAMRDGSTQSIEITANAEAAAPTDLAIFRNFFDRYGIDYHVESHAGPSGSPVDGAACSIELGLSVEFAFGEQGQFLDWTDFDNADNRDLEQSKRVSIPFRDSLFFQPKTDISDDTSMATATMAPLVAESLSRPSAGYGEVTYEVWLASDSDEAQHLVAAGVGMGVHVSREPPTPYDGRFKLATISTLEAGITHFVFRPALIDAMGDIVSKTHAERVARVRRWLSGL